MSVTATDHPGQTGDPGDPATARPWLGHYPDGVDWHMALAGGTLTELFDEAAARFADRPAFDFLGRRLSYGELAAQVDAAAAGFARHGVGRGTRVGLMLPNSPFYPVCYFAVLKAGGVVVNLNPLHAREQIRTEVTEAGVTMLVTVDLAALADKAVEVLDSDGPLERIVLARFASALPWLKGLAFQLLKGKEIARLAPDHRILPFERLIARGPSIDLPRPQPDDPAVLQFTGGTTGTPKAAVLSHANVAINAAQSEAWFVGARPGEERLLAVLPFFHVFAMTVGLIMGVRLGVEIVALPRFELDQVMKTIAKRRITLLPAVPTIYNAVAQHPRRERYDLSSIRLCISGGAALPVEVKQTFERLTDCTLFEGYGLTEAAPVVTCNPVKGLNKAGSIGQPIPGTELRIVSLEDRVTVLALGERGEVCVRGPQVMSGYLGQPDETAEVLRDGWLHTGDVGVMDEDGYVFIVDRLKDLIISHGYNIYPRTVEEAVYQHPSILECCVAGVPDGERGEAVKVYAALKPGTRLTLDELRGFLEDKLSPIEQPRHLELRDELPRTLIGKLSRKALKDEEEARRQAAG